jgi:hypothetical protein
MLLPIENCELSDTDVIAARLLRGWHALDVESGAFMYRTHGRGKYGLPKYVLILPNKSPEERGGLLERYDWDYPSGRKFIRAWTFDEALSIANERLKKMLSARDKLAKKEAA